jgi:hypothetical protein
MSNDHDGEGETGRIIPFPIRQVASEKMAAGVVIDVDDRDAVLKALVEAHETLARYAAQVVALLDLLLNTEGMRVANSDEATAALKTAGRQHETSSTIAGTLRRQL